MTILLLCLSLYSIYLHVDCVPCMYVIIYYVCMYAVYVRPSLANFSDDWFRNSNVIDTFFKHTRIGVRDPIRVENHWSTDWCVSLLIVTLSRVQALLVTWHWNCPTDHFCLFQTPAPMESGRNAILLYLSIVWGGQLWRLTVGPAGRPVPDESSRLAVGGEDARPRVGRRPHSRSSVLVGPRAAEHLDVGSSQETFADLIGKKAECLPLKLRILDSVNCFAS